MKITSKRKGKRRLKDFRIRFDGEIRSATGVWTEQQARAFLLAFWCFLTRCGATYEDWVLMVTPGKDKEEPIE